MSSNSFEQTPEQNSVALLTPTYERDLPFCALLCESVDRHARSFSKHYLLVPDSDLALFSRFEGPQRAVLPASQFLPAWLRPLPAIIRRQRRQHWWSLRARPVSGWHIQQILKIAAARDVGLIRAFAFDLTSCFSGTSTWRVIDFRNCSHCTGCRTASRRVTSGTRAGSRPRIVCLVYRRLPFHRQTSSATSYFGINWPSAA